MTGPLGVDAGRDPELGRRLGARLDLVAALALFLAAFVLTSAVALLVAALSGLDFGELPAERRLALAYPVQLGVYLVLLPLFLRRAGSFRPSPAVAWAVPWYLLFLLFWAPFTFGLMPWLLQQLDQTPQMQEHLRWFVDREPGPSWYAALVMVWLVGPLFEEVVFRGYLWRGLQRLRGPRTALWGSALAFGLVHLDAQTYVLLPLVLFGAFLAWLRQRSGTLLAPLLVHVLHNGWAVAVTLLGVGPIDGAAR